MEDKVELGGNIELSGFKDVDGGTMVIVKKIVGRYAKKFSEDNEKFEKLAVNLDKSFAFKCDLSVNGQTNSSEAEDKNLFVALDQSLKKTKHLNF